MSFNTELYEIPCVLMRGGTSRGLIIKDIDLPKDPIKRDAVITKIYGSSENGQIDGIGGGTSLTSKLAIVGVTELKACDIFYTFGQVDITSQKVDYHVTCGNMASAVGLYAVEEGFVPLKEGVTTVRIFNTNTERVMEVDVPVKNGEVVQSGDFEISGVSGAGPEIMVNFVDFGGAITGDLFPTGNITDYIKNEKGDEIEVSILDIGNVLVFARAIDFSLEGTELSNQINNDSKLTRQIEDIRVKCGRMIGLLGENEVVSPETHALPKIILVSEPQNYTDETEKLIEKNEINVIGRYITMGKLHRAFAVSGSIGMAAACKIPGTVPNQVSGHMRNKEITIGHPSGTIKVHVEIEKTNFGHQFIKGGTGRTARRIMEGLAIVPFNLVN